MTGLTVFKRINLLLLMGLFAMLVGCRLEVISPSGGTVTWSDGSCPAGAVCSFDVTDNEFNKQFTAEPLPGFEFVKWHAGSDFLCAGSTDTSCSVNSTGLTAEDLAPYQTSRRYVMPVYKNLGLGSGLDDTDGDGIIDGDDRCPSTPAGEAVDEFGCAETPDADTDAGHLKVL